MITWEQLLERLDGEAGLAIPAECGCGPVTDDAILETIQSLSELLSERGRQVEALKLKHECDDERAAEVLSRRRP